MSNYQIVDMIKKMDDNDKMAILHNHEFIEKNNISQFDLKSIIANLGDSAKAEILSDVDMVKQDLKFSDWQISGIVKTISSEECKNELIDLYKFDKNYKTEIITTYSPKSKTERLLKDTNLNALTVLRSFSINELEEFLNNNKYFCLKNDIPLSRIIKDFSVNDQKALVDRIDKFNLTTDEKKEVYASLKEDTKNIIDVNNLPEEYKTAISIKCNEYAGRAILDFNRNVEDYKGLDNLIKVKPEQFNEQEKEYLKKLCEVCPKLEVVSVIDEVVESNSTAKEYVDAEEWIASVIANIKPEYNDLQKMAVIDNEIGKKISYSPDFNTEVYNSSESRALWKIISSGYGVCNGIANVEKYIFKQVGIESEIVSSKTHAFLKVKNVQIPQEDGQIKTGNTILDPTWNLTSQKFGGRPDNFCISYEQARKHDIDRNGKDHNCHLNDEKLSDVNVSLNDQELRKLYTSVGLADKEGNFPIKNFMEKSKAIHKFLANDPEQDIDKQLLLLSKVCPDFAKSQESSMNVISDILLDSENLNFNKCVVNRVYNKEDSKKEPVIYVYMDSEDFGKKFYYANKEEGKFENLSQEDFTNKFECYETDLANHKGIRPWENATKEVEKVDLSRSSGEAASKEVEER